jgi:rhodanese-related sulfurtransferase|tara:strand:+ start:1330 stop:1698 length:369 start_codon:yes stop_codon:yes gene_type:complete
MTNINELLREANELVPRINFDDASALVDDPNTIILDVREEQELRESGKIKGAIHVPRGLLEFVFRPEDYVKEPEKMKILVYCAAGARAALAAKTLIYIGYKDVFNLGGFKEWVENGGEIEVI